MVRIFKKVSLPPLIPMGLVVLMSVWVLYSEANSAPRYIDGQVDDAPQRASGVMLLFAPVLYAIFLGINIVDYVFDSFFSHIRWRLSLFCMLGFGVLFGFVLYSPSVDTNAWIPFSIGLITSFVVALPMNIWRRSCWND